MLDEHRKKGLFSKLGALFRRGLDEDFYEELEEALILSDTGAQTAMMLCEQLEEIVKSERITDPKMAKDRMIELASGVFDSLDPVPDFAKKSLILVVGINGVGKTTAIGKLSHRFSSQGKKVLLAAADTFRAAAAEQLALWADRTGAQIVRNQDGSDPASVVFDAIAAGKARGMDIILCDTAGRLQNKKNLMSELEKIRRVIDQNFEGDVYTLLVLDAATGLNGLEQAKVFQEAAKVDGIMITKMDGTAKGGIALCIANQYRLPVWFLGVGEQNEDLEPFDAKEFVTAFFEG